MQEKEEKEKNKREEEKRRIGGRGKRRRIRRRRKREKMRGRIKTTDKVGEVEGSEREVDTKTAVTSELHFTNYCRES